MSRQNPAPVEYPEDLPAELRAHWPDLGRWPTPEDVTRFRKATRGNAAAKLAVLNGLRSWSVIDVSPIWAWASTLITVALAGLGVAIGVGSLWFQLLVLALVLVLAFTFLTVMISLSTKADARRRRAHVWLRALESAV